MGKIDLNSSKPISFTFAGCGFLGLYHVGVASCLREYAPINSTTRFAGASAGSLSALALVCDIPLGKSTSDILNVAIKARSRALGPFHPSFDVNKILYDIMVRTLPDDAHIRANGRLYVSVTRFSDGKNVIINKFKSKEELIKAIQCSCFIPLWSGLTPPKFNGIAYIDGGCSDNQPILDENTVTVSPFSGESDICPQDDTYSLFQVNFANTSIAFTPSNIYRLTKILFPAHPEILSKMCQQGFDDALRYLQRNNKISCTRCLAIHFTLEKEDEDTFVLNKVKKHVHHDKHSMENCRDCEYRRQIAVLDSLPESVVQAIQEACDRVNKGIINWLFRHKPMKLLSILSIPYLLPIDLTIVFFNKVYQKLPDIQQELKESFLRVVSLLQSLLVKIDSKRHFYSAKFSCQLAVKEIDYTSEENLARPRKSSSVRYSKSFSNSKARHLLEDADPKKIVEMDKSRKISYAGREIMKNNRPNYRRKSMIEIGNKVLPPERVISQLNFDFKLDVKDSNSETQIDSAGLEHGHGLDSKVLDIDINEIDQDNAIEIANKALDWEKEFLEKCHDKLNDSDGNFEKMFEITRKHDAVMAYYYTDENNKVKFTELFNIADEDLKKTSANDDDDKEERLSSSEYKDSEDGLLEKLESPGTITSSTGPSNSSYHHSVTPKKRQRKSSMF